MSDTKLTRKAEADDGGKYLVERIGRDWRWATLRYDRAEGAWLAQFYVTEGAEGAVGSTGPMPVGSYRDALAEAVAFAGPLPEVAS